MEKETKHVVKVVPELTFEEAAAKAFQVVKDLGGIPAPGVSYSIEIKDETTDVQRANGNYRVMVVRITQEKKRTT